LRTPGSRLFGRFAQRYGAPALRRSVRAQRRRDHAGLPAADPGAAAVVDAGLDWICRAQDRSSSRDGGVASHFSLIDGWSASYPETTGYIVPTVLNHARSSQIEALRDRAKRMLDWLVSVQLQEGGFPGGRIGQEPVLPVTFNTGQIVLGLAAGVAEFGEVFRRPLRRAADWLVRTQDDDGCWRGHPTPFARRGPKAYETHVAWGLLEAARVEPADQYVAAALANVKWALTLQRDNGWFDQCCLTDPARPLTHTLGYVLRGLVEAHRFTDDAEIAEAACRTADGLLGALGDDGFLPGRLNADWSAAVDWACLTGTAQIAHGWLQLFTITGDARYRGAAMAANRYVRRTISVAGSPETRGGVRGSFPIDGAYGRYKYLSWAAKFTVDANRLELSLGGPDDA